MPHEGTGVMGHWCDGGRVCLMRHWYDGGRVCLMRALV